MISHTYRPEIDGLRALAVLPVIFFHADFELFSGGFVGVDVFFVISGYLITSIIMREQQAGTFTLFKFYERRARRILPALFLVSFACLPFAWWLMTPGDMKDFSQSLIAVSTFSSNILFWFETSYWASASELKPLLHTWSLAVEEQFYLLYPLLLILGYKLSTRWIVGLLILGTLISFCLSIWGTMQFPSAAFYLLPTRAWELGIGALLAFNLLPKTPKPIEEFGAMVGIGLILGSVFLFDSQTPFPGYHALVPTLGTALVIAFASDETLAGRILKLRGFVFFGLISYSAYLWHQPMLAFTRIGLEEHLPTSFTMAIIGLTFLLAYLSWRFVETPIRTTSKRYHLPVGMLAALLLFLFGILGNNTDGYPSRSMTQSLSVEMITEKLKENRGLDEGCENEFTLSPLCRTSDTPDILIWGDSYAMQLVDGILASKPDARIIQMTKSVCGPVPTLAPVILPRYTKDWAADCLRFNQQVLSWLKDQTTVKYIVISSPFNHYLEDNKQLLNENNQQVSASFELALSEFTSVIQQLRALDLVPVIVSPPPANGNDLGRCLAQAAWENQSLGRCNFQTTEITAERQQAFQFLETLQSNTAVNVIWLQDWICPDGQCQSHQQDVFIYRDAGHLSSEGVQALGKQNNFYQQIVNSH